MLIALRLAMQEKTVELMTDQLVVANTENAVSSNVAIRVMGKAVACAL